MLHCPLQWPSWLHTPMPFMDTALPPDTHGSLAFSPPLLHSAQHHVLCISIVSIPCDRYIHRSVHYIRWPAVSSFSFSSFFFFFYNAQQAIHRQASCIRSLQHHTPYEQTTAPQVNTALRDHKFGPAIYERGPEQPRETTGASQRHISRQRQDQGRKASFHFDSSLTPSGSHIRYILFCSPPYLRHLHKLPRASQVSPTKKKTNRQTSRND